MPKNENNSANNQMEMEMEQIAKTQSGGGGHNNDHAQMEMESSMNNQTGGDTHNNDHAQMELEGMENQLEMDQSDHANQHGGRHHRRHRRSRKGHKSHKKRKSRKRHGGASAITRLAVPVSLYAAKQLMQRKKSRKFVRGVDKSLGRPGTRVIRGVARGFVGTARTAGRLVGLKSKKSRRKSRRSRRR